MIEWIRYVSYINELIELLIKVSSIFWFLLGLLGAEITRRYTKRSRLKLNRESILIWNIQLLKNLKTQGKFLRNYNRNLEKANLYSGEKLWFKRIPFGIEQMLSLTSSDYLETLYINLAVKNNKLRGYYQHIIFLTKQEALIDQIYMELVNHAEKHQESWNVRISEYHQYHADTFSFFKELAQGMNNLKDWNAIHNSAFSANTNSDSIDLAYIKSHLIDPINNCYLNYLDMNIDDKIILGLISKVQNLEIEIDRHQKWKNLYNQKLKQVIRNTYQSIAFLEECGNMLENQPIENIFRLK